MVSMQAPEAHTTWIQARRRAVTAPQGALSLVLTHWEPPGAPAAADAIARAGQPLDATITRLERTDIHSGAHQQGYRVWDPGSPALRAFDEIEYYDFDPAWVIPGRFEWMGDARVVPFEHAKDDGALRSLPASGDLVFTFDGTEYRMSAFDTDNGRVAKLQLVFGDPTNGVETYGAGRFLFLDHPAAASGMTVGDSIPITIDFNRAIVPPCGFSNHMNCPLPPPQNRLPFAVRAGEKIVRFRNGFSL
ncbi:DUF1684 domain-containing protein [Microbacterium deminutum]|uniref:DUF1684 domain-containing protein n=1 Tax=Microbacterium deminutum TaxID=344164 RepID=A0ABN2RED8_9MICO